MNYIKLINQFWKLRRSKRITSLQTDLYFFLIQECNERNWENPFECSNKVVIVSIGISEPSLIDARNRLKQLGLIDFIGGKRNEYSPVYTLLYLNDLSRNRDEALVNPLVETEMKGEPIRNKLNKTKESIDVNQPMPVNILEAAEMNQFTHTKNRNTEFLQEQWKVYLLERTNDPPPKIREYVQNPPELCRYFLNWIRNKFPKNGTAKNIPAPSGKQAGNAALYNRAKELFAGGTAND